MKLPEQLRTREGRRDEALLAAVWQPAGFAGLQVIGRG